MNTRLSAYLCSITLAALACFQPALAEEIRDYYAEPGLNPFKEALSEHFNEHIDPFSGTLQLKYTDLTVPGNGGLDINVVRTYTSLPTNSYPARAINGLGWTMHFGRVVVPRAHLQKICSQHLLNAHTADNPSLELQDGGRELLVLSNMHSDGTLITRSNWRARCLVSGGLMVTSPDGVNYTMNHFDNFAEEPSWNTTRIEDRFGNWINVNYAVNAVGLNYIASVTRNDGAQVHFEYEDIDGNGIALTAASAEGQRWVYQYELIPGFIGGMYKQMVRATRPDGRSWHYHYFPKMPDPNPDDQFPEEGIASYSLERVTYPYGAFITYSYQHVLFDADSPEKTTSIRTKFVGGQDVEGGSWTYTFAPHSQAFPHMGSGLRLDVTTVLAPEARYQYYHYGKDFYTVPETGQLIFVRPSFVGLLLRTEIYERNLNANLLERRENAWGQRKISVEDFWHGGNRGWWRDDGTYAPVLIGEYVSRDSEISGSTYSHAREFDDFDAFGNPGRIDEYSNSSVRPGHRTEITYHHDFDRWILGQPDDETHYKVVSNVRTEVGTVERDFTYLSQVESVTEFGEETRYTYNGAGDVETIRDARNKITRYTDYKRGIARDESRPEGVSISRIVNDSGTLRSETDGRGNLTSYTYDDLNRLTYINYPIKADVSIGYQDGNGTYERFLRRGDYSQRETINDFEQVLRLERSDIAAGLDIVRTSRFDSMGREVFTSYPNSSLGNATVYDALGRTLRITHPDNSAVRYVHDGATSTVKNERNFQTEYAYSVLGMEYTDDHPVLITEPESVITKIERDVWGNVTRLFQGERQASNTIRGYAKTYTYDEGRNLVESYEPEVGTTVFDHDAVGNVIYERVNNLAPVSFVYDGLNRRTRVDFSDDTPDIVTVYDASDNVERVTKGTSEWFYTYDANGNQTGERLTVTHALLAPRVYQISRQYSAIDVLSVLTYPSGLAVDYAPDNLGRATKVGAFASNIQYHASGAVKSYTLANGVTTTVTLNQRMMTQSITSSGVVDLSYDYDVGGNVTQITDGIDASRNVSMDANSYDGLDRLRQTTGSWGVASFAYDFHGNFVNKDVGQRGMRYRLDGSRHARVVERYSPANPNAITGYLNFGYDQRGNAVSRRSVNGVGTFVAVEEKLFDYDSASHLIRARVNTVNGGGTTVAAYKDYVYDGNGQRVLEQKHGSYDLLFGVHSGGNLLFEDSVLECVRTDHIRLGSLSIARSEDRTAPAAQDSDSDQIPDCLELQLGLNPNNAADAAADADADGLSNLEEFRAGTSLTRADTDGDGLSDRDELQRDLTDPTNADTDGDGIADGIEAGNPQLDPRSADKDHDGVSDLWETRLQTNPADGADGLLDTDGDGFSNRQESGANSDPQLAGTSPARGTSIWASNVPAAIVGSPVIGRDRTVYVAAEDSRVYAFWPDGTRRWVFGVASSTIQEPTVAPDGTVYLVTTIMGGLNEGAPRSFVRALSPEGVERWVYSTTDFLNTSVAIGEGGRLYAAGIRYNGANATGLVMSVNANGTDATAKAWASATLTTPVVAPNGDIYFTDENKAIYSFDKALGTRWYYFTRAKVEAPLAIGKDGTVYAGDANGYLYAVSSAGALRWEKFISTGPQLSSVAVANDGTVYVGAYQSALLALRPQDGSTIWSKTTSGTTFTPAIAANGNVYATTYRGDLYVISSAGADLWSYESGNPVYGPPVIDRDGTIYFGSQAGQLFAVADNAGGAALAPWAMHRHDSAASSYVCFNEPAFSIVADGDGDHIDDCAELRYGLDPANPADGNADADGDGLRNFEEHQAGTRLDLADTDGDGLSDGIEVLTYYTSPLTADTDHDGIPDQREIALSTDPLSAADGIADADNDGFSNRQEILANTDPLNASSHPVEGQVLRNESSSNNMYAVLGRDGTIYQSAANNSSIQAMYPDLSQRWTQDLNVVDSPAVLPDGMVFLKRLKSNGLSPMVALWPNGLTRWVYTLAGEGSNSAVFEPPAIGTDGSIYFIWSDSSLRAIDMNGVPKAGWPVPGVQVFAHRPLIAVGPSGNVVVYDSLNSVSSYSPTGVKQWESRATAILGGGNHRHPVVAPDGAIYLSNNNGVHAIDPTNGTRRWVRSNARGTPLIDANGNIIMYCGGSTGLCSVAPDGTTVWQEATGLSYVGTPAIDAQRHIFVLTNNNRFVAFNSDGTLRWNTSLGTETQTFAYDTSPMLLADGTIYVREGNRRILLVGAGSGLATTGWPSEARDDQASRNALGIPALPLPTAPAVMIIAPTTSSINVEVGENYSVRAQATDGVQGDISATIRWTSSLDGQFATGSSASLSSLRIGVHTVTATVTDGEGLSASKSFTVNKAVIPPVMYLSSPQDGNVFDVGQNITFQGDANDQLDGSISSRIRWTSSIDGLLYTGRMFSRNDLSAGEHTITMSATDNSGATGTIVLHITVQVIGPYVHISTPEEGQEVEFGLPIDFYASASDNVDGNVSDTIRWTSDRDGLLGTGAQITAPSLSLGDHVITATATDHGGTSGSKSVPITVKHQPPTVTIDEPLEGVRNEGDFVTLRARATDLRDGDVSSSIQWFSTLDGLIASGPGPINLVLGVGVHYVSAKATDSDGLSNIVEERRVNVRSTTNNAPVVSSVQPDYMSQFYAGDPVTFTAITSDLGGGTPTLQWFSDRDGLLGSGTPLTVSNLSSGTHTIRAVATDVLGAKGAERTRVVIVPAPADYTPSIEFQPYAASAWFTPNDAFPLTAIAIDREDGDISTNIHWSSNINGPLGIGGTVTVAGLTEGMHDITAAVTDSYGNTKSETMSLEINAAATPTFLSESFSSGSGLSEWEYVDDGPEVSSNWSILNGRVTESSDTQSGATAGNVIDKPGTYLRHKYGFFWLDYRLEGTLSSTDDDALGLMFRYIDNDNYYRFSMDRERSYRRLVKKVNGVYTTLWQDTTRYTTGSNVSVVVTAVGNMLTLSINGTQVFTGSDTSLRRGTVALYSWGENMARFDNVRVFNLRTSTSNDPPQMAISAPANNSSFVVGTPVTFSGTALDFEDGALTLGINWTSSRDGALGTGGSVTANALSLGAHVITASTVDSDGATGTATLNIGVNEPFNEPPTLNVTAPTQGATFNIGTAVSFAGTAGDVEDGNISNGITWTSSRNGALGSGASLSVSTLSAGAHVITARIQDSGGKFLTVTRNITVVVPGNTQPNVTISAPNNGAAYGVGHSVTLSGTATDTEDGTLTSQIAWSSSRDGALGTGGSLSVGTLSGGIHTITATVNDSMGGTRSVNLTLNIVPTAATLLRDDFNDGNYTGWTVTNQGTVSAPSAWSASTGVLRQTNDIHSTPTTVANLQKLGTFNRLNTGTSWTNYSVTTTLRSTDNDSLGVMFRCSSSCTNYYRFSMDSELSNRRITKLRNGTWTQLWQDSTAFQVNRNYILEIIANGSTITVKLDGVQLWSGTDSSNPLTSGTIAMYAWRNTGAEFDDVLVRDLSVPFSTIDEPKRGFDRLRTNPSMLASNERKPRPAPRRAPPERVALLTANVELRPMSEGVAR
jgi:YD repeat-containing protein